MCLMQRAGDKSSSQKALRQGCAGCVRGTERSPSKQSTQETPELDRAQIRKVFTARKGAQVSLRASEGNQNQRGK